MTKISFSEFSADIQAIVFDKDGTLIDFNHLWGQTAVQWVEFLQSQVDGSEALANALFKTIGYDAQTQSVVMDGPLAVTSMPKLYNLLAVVLYQHGVGWHSAESIVAQLVEKLGKSVSPAQIRPIGDVKGSIETLAAAGVKIVVATSDDRAPTEATLPILGIDHLVSLTVCGDDPLPNKPSKRVFEFISAEIGIPPNKMIMVGDTVSDMLTGRNGGAAYNIGIRGGAGDETALNIYANAVLDSIEGIRLAQG